MSYNKTTWSDGDVITSEKLNNIENGIENADVVMVTVTGHYDEDAGETVYTSDKTYAEILNMLNSGKYVVVVNSFGDGYTGYYNCMAIGQGRIVFGYTQVAAEGLFVIGEYFSVSSEEWQHMSVQYPHN